MPFQYQGGELKAFAKARRWKSYWASQIRQWLRGDVLEVGAGIGANTELFQDDAFERWTCLEPDSRLLEQIPARLRSSTRHHFLDGGIASLPADYRADAILYVDVLEHVADDAAELSLAAARLKPGGALVV